MKTEDVQAIRLTVVDLDGTLLTSKSTMAPEGASLLNMATRKGVHIILSTARTIHSTRDLCSSLETDSPVICANGAQIFDSIQGDLWKSFTFSKDIGLEIAKLADSNGWEISTLIGNTNYHRQSSGQTLGPIAPGREVVATNSDAVTGDLIRILVREPEAIDPIIALCETSYPEGCRLERYTARDGTKSLGIIGNGINKGTALDLVLERLGIRETEVMAIGDDLADLTLFSRARIKVAVGNAHPEVQKQASTIAPSNDAEGVAWAIKEFRV
jgi:Cof subfamily protein (haloacid dehalogenase superfamily)